MPGPARFLEARGKTNSTIFSPEENLHFPTNFKLFQKKFDSSPKISEDLFLVIYQKFPFFSPKTCSVSSPYISDDFLLRDLPHLFTKLGRCNGCPRLDSRGRRTPHSAY